MTEQPAPRNRRTRQADARATLAAPVADAWVATADGSTPYLVPLTIGWFEERIVIATADSSPTVRNLRATGQARVALGATRDVVLVDAVVERSLAVDDPRAAAVGEAYARQNDWDPRTAGSGYVFVWLRPVIIRAWREQNELANRVVMRDSVWLD